MVFEESRFKTVDFVCIKVEKTKTTITSGTMENAVSNDESGPITKRNVVPFDCLDDSTTQDACDFEEHFNDDSNQSFADESPEKTAPKTVLSIKIPNSFADFSKSTILSPMSDLAMNVEKTKLNSSDSVVCTFGK